MNPGAGPAPLTDIDVMHRGRPILTTEEREALLAPGLFDEIDTRQYEREAQEERCIEMLNEAEWERSLEG